MQIPWKIIVCLQWADNLRELLNKCFLAAFGKVFLRNSRGSSPLVITSLKPSTNFAISISGAWIADRVWWLDVLPLVLWVALFYLGKLLIPRNNFFATKTPESLLCFLDSQCLLVIALNHERQPFHSRVRARPRSERTECRNGDSLNTHALSAYLACCQQNVFQIIETQQCPAVGLPWSSIQQHSCRHIKALKSKWHNTIRSSNILSLRIVFFWHVLK